VRRSLGECVHGRCIGEAELAEIEQRATLAFAVAPTPWTSFLETGGGLGGESFIRLGNDPVLDHELYVRLHLASEQIVSPDAVIDFIAHAAEDIRRLIAEVRQLRTS
jgi:hypothetical protein